MIALVFAAEIWLAATTPVSVREAYLYDQFVRPRLHETLEAPHMNGEVLYVMLEKRAIGLFHATEFSIRIPSLIFGGLYLCILMGFLPSQRSWLAWPAVLAAAVAPLGWNLFSTARGTGAALALLSFAVVQIICYLQFFPSLRPQNLNLAGGALGLAVAADVRAAIPAAILACIFIGFLAAKGQWRFAVDRLMVTAAVCTFIFLVLPIACARSAPADPPAFSASQLGEVRSQVASLRARPSSEVVHVGADPATSVRPLLGFYRARFRVSNWDFTGPLYDVVVTVR